MSNPLTGGVHHVGLTVTDLDASCSFFTDLLGWRKVGGDPAYPAAPASNSSCLPEIKTSNHASS